MAWVRVDDGFTHHPKIVKLPRADRWTWLEVLCYAARFRTDGVVPAAVGEVVRGATGAFLERCVSLRLLDRAGDDYLVHDWSDYNGRDPKIMQAERQRKRRDIAVTDAVTEPVKVRDVRRDETVTRAQARARVPQPQPQREEPNGSSLASERPRNPVWDALGEVFGEPTTSTARTLRGRTCASLAAAGATRDEIVKRAKSWPRHFADATLTETALEKHWDALGRPPLRLEAR